ncbi:damage-inducible protein DinB [Bacillus sp. FJAT-42376]|uniref:DinB family protein n=1 Tax=Bacillus sp. FJAT-42376 TaxID=2014076 RepID=UPI000F4D400B|nr:DinB family protein [Bacillus sp. FJAT-42376]AZB44895.1 damage-inducible protein DinB [Bacillus sp. FJAT-42376]
MQTLFAYNWMVREEWYKWCEEIPEKELLQVRTGGVGGILHTLFHIADVEWSWIRGLEGKPDFQENFEGYRSLEKVKRLDEAFKPEVKKFVEAWDERTMNNKVLANEWPDGSVENFTWGEVMRHVIAHEIHHIGQLSVWARETGRKPVSANVIRRGLIAPR